MALTTLYPPVVGTYGKTFLLDSGSADKDMCKVYFSLSQYNTLSEIMGAQVTIVFQDTNRTALNTDKYPCEIMLTSIYQDASVISDEKYYIQISKNDIKGGTFQINTYYKVQIRFTSTEATLPQYGEVQDIDSWLVANQNCFSEWSTVCLVRGISTPMLTMSGLDDSAGATIWITGDTKMSGSLKFLNNDEKDILKSYRMKLYNARTDELVTDSGLQYANSYNNVNQINYTLKCDFKDDEKYRLEIGYTTNMLYTAATEYEFTVQQTNLDILEATISTIVDEENGRIGILLQSLEEESAFMGRLTIRRTSSESNYTVWEDVYSTAIVDSKALNLVWYDYSVESGIWYKYSAQRRNSIGARGVSIYTEEPVIINYEYCFLVGDNKQLKLKYNPSVNSFKRNIAESKIDTLGSKYPFVRRNGDMDYRSFSLSGLITRFMDEEEIFVSEDELLNGEQDAYSKYNEEKRINKYNDTLYEKKFRDKVLDFLHENTIKLFRSPAEGNILVKLMDISLTPMQGLEEYIYTFSANAVEIAECTTENLDTYNIQSCLEYYIDKSIEKSRIEDSLSDNSKMIAEARAMAISTFSLDDEVKDTSVMATDGETQSPTWQVKFSNIRDMDNSLITYVADYIGQEDDEFKANTEILETLLNKYTRYQREGYVIKIDYLDSLRIEMLGEPILIEDSAAGPVPATSTSDMNKVMSGWLIYINDKAIIIQGDGVYELKNNSVKVTSLKVPVDTKMDLQYHAQLSQTEDITKLTKSISYYAKVGQRWGTFDYTQTLKNVLINKYTLSYTSYSQALKTINGVRLEADPGTLFYVKETGEEYYQRHIIGETCELLFYDRDITIDDVVVVGLHLEEATAAEKERENLPETKFIETGISVSSLSDITSPIDKGVYIVTSEDTNGQGSSLNQLENEIEQALGSSNRYIWCNNTWYKITSDNDIIKPTSALIDYYCEIMKGTFAV